MGKIVKGSVDRGKIWAGIFGKVSKMVFFSGRRAPCWQDIESQWEVYQFLEYFYSRTNYDPIDDDNDDGFEK